MAKPELEFHRPTGPWVVSAHSCQTLCPPRRARPPADTHRVGRDRTRKDEREPSGRGTHQGADHVGPQARSAPKGHHQRRRLYI
jgi:hypothetical protein